MVQTIADIIKAQSGEIKVETKEALVFNAGKPS